MCVCVCIKACLQHTGKLNAAKSILPFLTCLPGSCSCHHPWLGDKALHCQDPQIRKKEAVFTFEVSASRVLCFSGGVREEQACCMSIQFAGTLDVGIDVKSYSQHFPGGVNCFCCGLFSTMCVFRLGVSLSIVFTTLLMFVLSLTLLRSFIIPVLQVGNLARGRE